jgi:hypothetical protein
MPFQVNPWTWCSMHAPPGDLRIHFLYMIGWTWNYSKRRYVLQKFITSVPSSLNERDIDHESFLHVMINDYLESLLFFCLNITSPIGSTPHRRMHNTTFPPYLLTPLFLIYSNYISKTTKFSRSTKIKIQLRNISLIQDGTSYARTQRCLL